MKKIVIVIIIFFGLGMRAEVSLDSSFGVGGLVTSNFGGINDQVQAVIQQPDGKIITVGGSDVSGDFEFALARYNIDGSLDTSFGTGGLVVTSFDGTADLAEAALLQPDGKIVAAGHVISSGLLKFALARYHADGSLDSLFAPNGKLITSFGAGNDEGFAAVIQANGRIIAAGTSDASGTKDFALARYLIPSISISQFARDLRAKYFLLQ